MKRAKYIYRFWFAIGSVLSLLYAFPFFLVLINSFKDRRTVRENPLSWPEGFALDNFTTAIKRMEFWQALTNSVMITVLGVVSIVLVSSMLAFYLARSRTKFSGATFLILVTSMIVPFQALMIPFSGLFGKAGLNVLNNQFWLVFFYVGFGVAMSTFLYHGFIKNIPMELDEAAALDGASAWTTFWRVIFPMLSPVTATVAIINGLWIWNDYLLPSIVLLDNDIKTVPLRTFVFYGQYTSDYGLAMAALVMSIIPIVIFYFAMQRQIIQGISAGAVK
ncbi:MAG: carbohydrate ABC transporter permease [Actinomycetota bacterium]